MAAGQLHLPDVGVVVLAPCMPLHAAARMLAYPCPISRRPYPKETITSPLLFLFCHGRPPWPPHQGCRELPCPVHLRPNWMHLRLLQLALNLPSPSFNRDHHWRTACCSGCRHGCCHYHGHAWPDGHGPYSVKLRAHEGAAWRLQAPTPLLCRRRAPHGRNHDLRRVPLFPVRDQGLRATI